MHCDFEGGQQRFAMQFQWKLIEVRLRRLAQIGKRFFDRLALCRCAGFRIDRDETAFLGRNHTAVSCMTMGPLAMLAV